MGFEWAAASHLWGPTDNDNDANDFRGVLRDILGRDLDRPRSLEDVPLAALPLSSHPPSTRSLVCAVEHFPSAILRLDAL